MKALACTATEAEILTRAQAGDESAQVWLWKKHGQFITLSMLDHAHETGGTSARWGEASTILEYSTVGFVDASGDEIEEGVVYRAEPSTAWLQEGSLEQEFRSAAADVFISATKKFDPEWGTPYRIWLWICARNAVKDIKDARFAGLVGKSRKADAAVRTEPYQGELEAKEIADRILEVRSEAYVSRWCARDDVDDVDRDIVRLNLVLNGSQPFHNLADIAARQGISRQAVAKRRDRIVDDLIGATNKRQSDGASHCRNGRRLGSWLSDFQGLRTLCRRDKHSAYRPHRDHWEALVDGQWLRINLSDDPVLSSHRNGKITDAELDLIHEYRSAFEAFAHGTGFNLGSGAAWKELVISPSTDDMRDFFEGEPDGAVRLLTAHQKEAMETIARCRVELELDRKPEAQRVPVRVRWAELFYSYPSDSIRIRRRRREQIGDRLRAARSPWRCDELEPLIAAPPLQPNEPEFCPVCFNHYDAKEPKR